MEELIRDGYWFTTELNGKSYECKITREYHNVSEYFPNWPSWWTIDFYLKEYEIVDRKFLWHSYKAHNLIFEHMYQVARSDSPSFAGIKIKRIENPDGGAATDYFYPENVKDWIEATIRDNKRIEAERRSNIEKQKQIKHKSHV